MVWYYHLLKSFPQFIVIHTSASVNDVCSAGVSFLGPSALSEACGSTRGTSWLLGCVEPGQIFLVPSWSFHSQALSGGSASVILTSRDGEMLGDTKCGPDPVASVTCHVHLKGGGKEEEKLCGQLTVSVKRSSFLF